MYFALIVVKFKPVIEILTHASKVFFRLVSDAESDFTGTDLDFANWIRMCLVWHSVTLSPVSHSGTPRK